MPVKLSSDDRCAIDLVLESRAEGDGSFEECFGKSSAGLQRCVGAVERVLGTLAEMPAPDAPANLAARTLKFVRKHEHDVVTTPAARRAAVTYGVSHRAMQ